MSKVLNYNDFLNEKYRKTENDYAVGDIVIIRYYLTGDLVPAKIISKKTHNYFIVSHKVENSPLFNASDHGIKLDEIIGRYKGVDDPVNTTDRKTMNPSISPSNGGIIPGGDSWSNDISF
jgi:hypothetical protein